MFFVATLCFSLFALFSKHLESKSKSESCRIFPTTKTDIADRNSHLTVVPGALLAKAERFCDCQPHLTVSRWYVPLQKREGFCTKLSIHGCFCLIVSIYRCHLGGPEKARGVWDSPQPSAELQNVIFYTDHFCPTKFTPRKSA